MPKPDLDVECKHCGKDFGRHRSSDYACPVLTGNVERLGITDYRDDQRFEKSTESMN